MRVKEPIHLSWCPAYRAPREECACGLDFLNEKEPEISGRGLSWEKIRELARMEPKKK